MSSKRTCHVYGQIHKCRIQEAKEVELDAQSSKTNSQKLQRWQRVEKQKALKLKTQMLQLKQLKKHGSHSRKGESSTAPLNTPVQREPPTTRSATPAVGTHLHYLWVWLPTVWTERGLSQRVRSGLRLSTGQKIIFFSSDFGLCPVAVPCFWRK